MHDSIGLRKTYRLIRGQYDQPAKWFLLPYPRLLPFDTLEISKKPTWNVWQNGCLIPQSLDCQGMGEPVMARGVWAGNCIYLRKLWRARRLAKSPGTAGLAGSGIHGKWLGYETPIETDGHLHLLPAESGS